MKIEEINSRKTNRGVGSGCSKYFYGLLLVLLLLFVTNPREYKLRNELKNEGFFNIHDIQRENLRICSFYVVRSIGTNGIKQRVYLGILGNFIMIEEQ